MQLVAKELPPPEFVAQVCARANHFWSQHPDEYIGIHCAYGKLATLLHARLLDQSRFGQCCLFVVGIAFHIAYHVTVHCHLQVSIALGSSCVVTSSVS